ncbi:MAG: hypothetical protein ACK5LP_04825 [Campylobacteraceae bacterium]
MLDFIKVETKIAFIIAIQNDTSIVYIKYKDIAKALNIKYNDYILCRHRNKIPLPEICEFCKKNYIAINWVLYAQSSIDLKESFRIKEIKELIGENIDE